MEKIEKGLQFLMVAVIVLMVLTFFVTIAVGHATNYDFLYSIQHGPELTNTVLNSNVLL